MPIKGFSWNGCNPYPTKEEAKHEKSYQALMQRNFTRRSDYVVSQSIEAGSVHLLLWSSGRITEVIQHLPRKKGDRLTGTEKEVVPPFDFIGAHTAQ